MSFVVFSCVGQLTTSPARLANGCICTFKFRPRYVHGIVILVAYSHGLPPRALSGLERGCNMPRSAADPAYFKSTPHLGHRGGPGAALFTSVPLRLTGTSAMLRLTRNNSGGSVSSIPQAYGSSADRRVVSASGLTSLVYLEP